MRDVRLNGGCRSPPHPRPSRPERERPRHKAQVGTTYGGAETQDPRGLPDVSHGHPPRAEQSANADINHWRAGCGESRTSGSEGGRRKSAPLTRGNSPAAYLTQGARLGPGHRRRHPRRRVRQVPQPHRDPCSAGTPRPSSTCSTGSRRRSGRSSGGRTSTAGYSGTASRRSP